MIRPHYALLSVCIGCICGMHVALFISASYAVFIAAFCVACILCIFTKLRSAALLIAFGFIGAFLGMLRMEAFTHTTSPLAAFNDGPVVTLSGVISHPIDVRLDHKKITFNVEEASLSDERFATRGLVLIKTPLFTEAALGDTLSVTGKLQTPKVFDDGFDYGAFLARSNIFSVMYYPSIRITGSGEVGLVTATLDSARALLRLGLARALPQPEAGLADGLLTGARAALPPSILEHFNMTGLTHIIAVSGYNIALVILCVRGLCARLVHRWLLFFMVAFSVLFFTLFVGAEAGVTRAAIMGTLSFFALTAGRQVSIFLLILFTATVMLVHTPTSLISDISFQLSFAAVLGILLLSPSLTSLFSFVSSRLYMRESLVLTLAAGITTLPIISYHFDRVSIISPLANMLVAPLIPPAMLMSAIATFFGIIAAPLGMFVGSVAYVILYAILFMAGALAALPLASISAPFSAVLIFSAFSMCALMTYGYYISLRQKQPSS